MSGDHYWPGAFYSSRGWPTGLRVRRSLNFDLHHQQEMRGTYRVLGTWGVLHGLVPGHS